jgi:hypothetical protein
MPTLYRVAFERTRLDGRVGRDGFAGALSASQRGLAAGGLVENDDEADHVPVVVYRTISGHPLTRAGVTGATGHTGAVTLRIIA